jgi:hypothetical protein
MWLRDWLKPSAGRYTFTGQVQTASGEQAIQQMIMEGGPVETAFTVYSDFENYAGGVYSHTTGSMVGGQPAHASGNTTPLRSRLQPLQILQTSTPKS